MADKNIALRFITAGQNTERGLPGYLQKMLRSFGQATVLSGQTSIDVTDTDIKSTDLVIASVLTKGTNAAYVVGVTITAGTKFNVAVNTDPGVGGAKIAYVVLRDPTL
jgi:hypothetical protein